MFWLISFKAYNFIGDIMFKKYFLFIFSFILSFILLFNYNFNSSNLYFPVRSNYYITSDYGYRKLGTYHFHSGIDIGLCEGTKLYALSIGTVIFLGYSSSYGNSIIISYDNGYKSLYGHTSSNYLVKVGDRVSNNTVVALVGPKYLSNGKLNGFTTGPHLHFTLYKNNKIINPLSIRYK